MSTLGLIPARAGSRRVTYKNTRLLAGKPLIAWTIETALQSDFIDRVVVSTEDPEIARIANEWGADVPFIRPSDLARDDTPGIAPVLHALGELDTYTDVMLLQPTSPFRTVEDIAGIMDLRETRKADSAVSVRPSPWPTSWQFRMGMDHALTPLLASSEGNGTSEDGTFVLNGAMYLATRDFILSNHALTNSETLGYVMPLERSLDIDTPLDWLLAEFIAGGAHV